MGFNIFRMFNTVKRHRKKFAACPNCGSQFLNEVNFCPRCGQENRDLNVPAGHLIGEFFESTLHFDSKLIRTLKILISKPGALTAEFIAGKRKCYVPPIRLYVFVSVLFFFLLALLSGRPHTDGGEKQNQINLAFYTIKSHELRGLSEAQIDSLLVTRGFELTSFNRAITYQLGRIASGGEQEFDHLLFKNISYMMFILMPVSAVIVFLLYRKSMPFYFANLIFSIHLHTIVFLLLILSLLIGWRSFPFALIILLVYTFLSLRRIGGESRSKTLGKVSVMTLCYIALTLLCFSGAVLVSVLLF